MTTSKTALITGASRGLGETLARFLAAQDWTLILTARGSSDLARLAAELPAATAIPGDVTDDEHRAALARSVGDRLDLLVNNASALGGIAPLSAADPARIRAVLEANVVAPVELTRLALPALRAAGGLVVNISSDAAVGGYEGWGAYGASKAALDLVSLTLANELRPDGVGVVAVDPGDMRTAMHREAFPGEDISDRPLPDVTTPFWAWLIGQNPLAVSGTRFRAQSDAWELGVREEREALGRVG